MAWSTRRVRYPVFNDLFEGYLDSLRALCHGPSSDPGGLPILASYGKVSAGHTVSCARRSVNGSRTGAEKDLSSTRPQREGSCTRILPHFPLSSLFFPIPGSTAQVSAHMSVSTNMFMSDGRGSHYYPQKDAHWTGSVFADMRALPVPRRRIRYFWVLLVFQPMVV